MYVSTVETLLKRLKDKGVPVMCCGEAMHELKAGVTDAAVEKHVPVYTVDGNQVHVVVGETKTSNAGRNILLSGLH